MHSPSRSASTVNRTGEAFGLRGKKCLRNRRGKCASWHDDMRSLKT